jgi:hypothetical protein
MSFKHLLAAAFVVFAAVQTAQASHWPTGNSRSQLSQPVYRAQAPETATAASQPEQEFATHTVRCGVSQTTVVASSGQCLCPCVKKSGVCTCENCDCCQRGACACQNGCRCQNKCTCGGKPCICPQNGACRCGRGGQQAPQFEVAYAAAPRR